MTAMGGKPSLRSARTKGYADRMKPILATGLLALIAASQPAVATDTSAVPEENYDFLLVTSGPCVPRIGVGIEPKHRVECGRMTEPRLYRGTWFVAFETSLFAPIGRESCGEMREWTSCAALSGSVLPWPSRWACPRKFKVEFIGRRNALPGFDPAYRIVVDKVISVKRLPDPPHEAGECDPTAS